LFIVSDYIAVTVSFFIWCRLRASMGFFTEAGFLNVFYLSLFIYVFWLILFFFFGHYRTWFSRSRIDEFISITKTVTIGLFIIFIITADLRKDLESPFNLSRMLIFAYWALMIFFTGTGRILLLNLHRRLLKSGIGLRKTVIVGTGVKALELEKQVRKTPTLGYSINGFVSTGLDKEPPEGVCLLGRLDTLSDILHSRSIQEVLIGIDQPSEEVLEKIIAECDGTDVGIKIIPDLYSVIVGQVRTNQIFGFPLIEILPQIMPMWEWRVKRFADVTFSILILLAALPILLLLAAVIKMDSRGPVFYCQKRVGMNGRVYTMLKFRSMVHNAEEMTGPVWAMKNDPRVTRLGKIMRKTRLDELPQLLNVIKGDMSWVGPRPERPMFVDTLKKEIPLYARRLKVRPGITGWAQIKGEYDQSLEHVRQKLTYDLFYIENMSLRMDLKIIIITILVMIKGKGQ